MLAGRVSSEVGRPDVPGQSVPGGTCERYETLIRDSYEEADHGENLG